MRAVNLIPGDQRGGNVRLTGRSEGAAFIVIALIAGLAILAFMYGKARNEVSSSRGEAAKLTEQARATEARASQLTPYANFNTLYEERVKTVSELIGTRFDWAHAFHELGRVLPTNVSLSSVAGTIGGSSGSTSTTTSAAISPTTSTSASSATPPGSVPTMTIAGCTSSQSDVAVALSRLRLINGVSEVQLQSSSKGGSSGSSAGGASSGSGSCPVTFSTTVTFTALPSPSVTTTPHTTPASNTPASVPGTPASTPSASTQSATTTPARAQTATTSSNSNSSTAPTSSSTHTVSTATVNTSGGD